MNKKSKPPLKLWAGKQLVSTPCSNIDAMIEWLFVPYIVEDDPDGVEVEDDDDDDDIAITS